METINFKIRTTTESYSGEAVIVEDYNEGTIYIMNNTPWDWDDVKTNEIGTFEGYEIFANYVDPGSVDYSYFAVKKH